MAMLTQLLAVALSRSEAALLVVAPASAAGCLPQRLWLPCTSERQALKAFFQRRSTDVKQWKVS